MTMKTLLAERALLADGWARDVRVTLGGDGRIAAVETGAEAGAGDERLAGRIGGGAETNLRGYFLFGVSYGTASLSCTLPIFLTVVGSSIAVSNLASSLGQFLLYGLGMGVVILALTISIALFRSALVGQMRRLLPYVERVGTALLLVAGTYIVYYWLTIGGLLDQIG